MAERTTERTTIECPPAVREQLKAYQAALQRDLNRRASQGEIIGALLWGVPLWQADAILSAYRPHSQPIGDHGSVEHDE